MRLFIILKFFIEYFIFYKINKHRKKSLGRRIREASEKLGVTFVKLGQILSTRYDLLSKNDCLELQKLLDNTSRIPFSVIKKTIQRDFKKPLDEIFLEFEEKPLASASVSQVHRAKLHSGESVAIKIKRPGIDKIVREDIKALNLIVNFLCIFSSTLRFLNKVKLIKQMEGWLLQEINFRNEVKNIILFRKDYERYYGTTLRKNLGQTYFLDVFTKYCTQNIITTNYVKGITLNKIQEIKQNPIYDAEKSFRSYLSSATNAFFTSKNYIFMGDPHPANFIVLPQGGIVGLDYGLLCHIKEKELKVMNKLLLAVYTRNLELTIKTTLQMCEVDEKKYFKKVKQDIKEYLHRSQYEGLGFWFTEMTKIMIKHRIPIPPYLVSFGRCMVILDGVSRHINPNLTTLDLLGEELRIAMKQKMFNNFREINFESSFYILSEKLKQSPTKLDSVIEVFFDDPKTFVKEVKNIL